MDWKKKLIIITKFMILSVQGNRWILNWMEKHGKTVHNENENGFIEKEATKYKRMLREMNERSLFNNSLEKCKSEKLYSSSDLWFYLSFQKYM